MDPISMTPFPHSELPDARGERLWLFGDSALTVKVAQRRGGSGFSRDQASQAPATSPVTAASPRGCEPLPGKPFILNPAIAHAKTPRRQEETKGSTRPAERPMGEPDHFDNALKCLGELGALA